MLSLTSDAVPYMCYPLPLMLSHMCRHMCCSLPQKLLFACVFPYLRSCHVHVLSLTSDTIAYIYIYIYIYVVPYLRSCYLHVSSLTSEAVTYMCYPYLRCYHMYMCSPLPQMLLCTCVVSNLGCYHVHVSSLTSDAVTYVLSLTMSLQHHFFCLSIGITCSTLHNSPPLS